MSKKVLKYAGRRPMLLALIMATMTLGLLFSGWFTPTPTRAQTGGGNQSSGNENTGCSNITWVACGGNAKVVMDIVNISPSEPANAPYDSIVCVGDSISAHMVWYPLPSTNIYYTFNNCTTDFSFTTGNGASPYNITNQWWNSWNVSWTNGFGDSVPPFTFTNATTGSLCIYNLSSEMTTNQPGCGCDQWAPTNVILNRSYAFVEVGSISANGGYWVTNVPCDTYLVAYCPSNYVTVTASPNPGMDDKFLPAGWTMSGGLDTTNADGSPSRTKKLVDTGIVGSTNVTARSGGCSSKSVKIIVYQAKIEMDADRGNSGILHGAFNVGHAWWNLTIQPADVYPFLMGKDPDTGIPLNLQAFGPQGIGGYYPKYCHLPLNIIGPGVVHYGPQPDGKSGAIHSATGTYWWCVSIGCYVDALQYIYNLNDDPGTYALWGNQCTSEAKAVGFYGCTPAADCASNRPWNFSDFLNSLPQPATCSCN